MGRQTPQAHSHSGPGDGGRNISPRSVDTERQYVGGRLVDWSGTVVADAENGSFTTSDSPDMTGWGNYAVHQGGGANTDWSAVQVPYEGGYALSVAITATANAQVDIESNYSGSLRPDAVRFALQHNKESDYGSSFSFMNEAADQNVIDVQLLDSNHSNATASSRTMGLSWTDSTGTQQGEGTYHRWDPNVWYLFEALMDWDAEEMDVYYYENGKARFWKSVELDYDTPIDRLEIETNSNNGTGAQARRFFVDSIEMLEA